MYLHWNGGRDSVEPFLAYAKAKGVRGPVSDNSYAMARLAQIIGNFFGGTLSLGTLVYDPQKDPDYNDINPGDNGVYVVDDEFNIVSRNHCYGEQREYDFAEMLAEINSAQPKREQLTDEQLKQVIDNHNATKGEK